MSIEWGEIIERVNQRRNADAGLIRRMIEVRTRFNGDLAIPLVDVKGEPTITAPAPQIVADAIEGLAMRASSTTPQIICPALDDSDDDSRQRAATRRRATYATWYNSALAEVQLRRMYRHYSGYGTCSAVVIPDFTGETPMPRIELRDPLSSYPEQRTPDDIREPRNIAYVYGRSTQWLLSRYPEALPTNGKFRRNADLLWDLCEWVDEDEIVVGLLGVRSIANSTSVPLTNSAGLVSQGGRELRRYPNKAGMVTAICPRRVTLDRVLGQVFTAVGMTDILARLTALDIVAAERAIFPDIVILGANGRPPQLVGGRWKDGRTGEANEIQDGTVHLLQGAPGPLTHPVIDRVERAARITAGDSPYYGGESNNSLRTGRAIDAMGGYSIDPRIQEAQEVVGRSLGVLNEAICATYLGYWPSKKFTLFSGWPTDTGTVTFTPKKDFETHFNVVRYPFPGADLNNATVAISSLVAGRLISRESGRMRHPLIPDGAHENERIIEETILDSIFQSALQQLSQGAMPLIDGAAWLKLVRGGEDVAEALLKVDAEARKRQSAQTPPPGMTAAEATTPGPGGQAPPGQQAGLALPGVGAEAGLNRQPPPPNGVVDLHRLFTALGGQGRVQRGG